MIRMVREPKDWLSESCLTVFIAAGDLGNEAKLDDAYLKMKRLDKALEEAFEKEKQVKIETMSLMKK